MASREFYIFIIVLFMSPILSYSQQAKVKDSVIYRFTYRDTIIYRFDTVRIKHFLHSDTVWTTPAITGVPKKKKWAINPNNWGIGPSIGTYYSPYNGFDVNVGFGIQYYLLAVPSFRNPHLGRKKHRK